MIAILLSGKKQVGKDTFASIAKEYGYESFALADEMKKSLQVFLYHTFNIDIPLSYFYDNDRKENYVLSERYDKIRTIRKAMQWYGQLVKKEFGELFWVEMFYDKMKTFTYDKIIITDIRFLYELEFFKQYLPELGYGTLPIRIYRNNLPREDFDISEINLDSHLDKFKIKIYNDSDLDSFERSVRDVLQNYTTQEIIDE